MNYVMVQGRRHMTVTDQEASKKLAIYTTPLFEANDPSAKQKEITWNPPYCSEPILRKWLISSGPMISGAIVSSVWTLIGHCADILTKPNLVTGSL